VSHGLVEHCLELLAPLGKARSRRMFGGFGLYVDDLFVALILSQRLYLKADAQTRSQFEAAGGEPFVYEGKTAPVIISYWTVPPQAMDSPDGMQPWARLALDAALRAKLSKPARRRSRPTAKARAALASKRRATPPPKATKARRAKA
jgi:DNA transformation protein